MARTEEIRAGTADVEAAPPELAEAAAAVIAESSPADFEGNALAWGWWCRELALAAAAGNLEEFDRLTQIELALELEESEK